MAENKKDITKMATIYAQEGKWDKAILEYKKLITLDPTDYNIHNMLGDAYAKKGEDANAYVEYIQTAEAYLKQGLVDKAALVYKKIARLNSEKLPEGERQKQILIKKHTIAEKYIEEGEIDKAIETYKEILKLSPANFETYQKLGELHSEKGEKDKALEYYKKIVDIYFKNRLYKKALPIYQKILEIIPDDILTRERIAEIYEREGNEPDGKREYLFLAEYYWKQKNIEKTDFYAQKAIEFKSIEAHFFKGAALYEKKEIREAKKEIEMLLKFKSNHIGALNILSVIYTELGQIEDAMATLDKVIKIDQENVEAYENLADLYIKKNNNKEAISKYLVAVNICHSKQLHEKAIEILEKAVPLDPKNIEILTKLGDTFAKINKKREAANIYLKISNIYRDEKMPDKENEFYKMAADIDPGHPEIIQHAKKLAGDVKSPKPAQPTVEIPEKPAAELPKKQVTQEKTKIFHSYFDQLDSVKPVDLTPSKPKTEKKISQDPVLEELPEIEKNIIANKQEVKVTEMEKEIPRHKMFVSPQPAVDDDVPALIAMGDNYVKTGSFDEAIEMYQRALAMEPNNQQIKKKLTDLYSKYAGTSIAHVAFEDDAKKKIDEDRKKATEEARKKFEEAKKKAAEEARKKEEEEKKKAEEARKKEEEEKKKAAEEARKKEEEEKKKAAEEARKKEEEEKKKAEEAKKKEEARKMEEEQMKKQESLKSEDESVDFGISDDFVTVTTAEIFIKQGIYTEAEKILKKILAQDPSNIEAKMKLDELQKMISETEQKGVNIQDEDTKKASQSKVTYI